MKLIEGHRTRKVKTESRKWKSKLWMTVPLGFMCKVMPSLYLLIVVA